MGIKTYREKVNSVLKDKQTSIEMGLAKVREQESFIDSVARKLSATSWSHQMIVGYDFEVTFMLETGCVALNHQKDAIKQHLNTIFNVVDYMDGLVVSDIRYPEISCLVVIGGWRERNH